MANSLNTIGQAGIIMMGAGAATKMGFLETVEPWFGFVGLVIGGCGVIVNAVGLLLKHRAEKRKG